MDTFKIYKFIGFGLSQGKRALVYTQIGPETYTVRYTFSGEKGYTKSCLISEALYKRALNKKVKDPEKYTYTWE